MSVPASAAGLLIYDSLRSVFLYSPSLHFLNANARIRNSRQQLAPILAGAIGRTVVATVFSPIELFRTRLQSLPRSSSFTFVLKSIVDVVKTKGFRTLWKGLPATLWRDVPFSSVYWFSYETLQKATTGSGFGEGVVEKGGEAFANSFFCGATSGAIAAVSTNGFDVIKSRRQASTAVSKEATLAIFARIVRQEGLAGLFKGLTPRLAKIAPACGLMIR